MTATDDREWQDGDDTALYDQGYNDGIKYAVSVVDSILNKPKESLQMVPTEYTLKIIKHSILWPEED